MISLKLVQIGKSVGVAIPEAMLERLHLTEGDSLCLIETLEGYMLVPEDSSLAGQVKAAEAIMHADRSTLKALKE